jgi:hypothetical protein
MNEDDRKAILRRRTFFVTSALAALGSCARTTPPATEPNPENVVNVPVAEEDAGEVAESPPPAERDAASHGDLPPLDVPDGVGEVAKRNYEVLYRVMKESHRLLGEIEAELPKCNILDSACEPRFARLATKFQEMDDQMSSMRACGGSSPEAKAYREREALHFRFLSERKSATLAEIDRLLAPGGGPASDRWKAQLEAAEAANPRPCLKYACPDW